MTCHRFCTQNNMTSVTSGAGNAYPSGTPELISDVLVGFVLLNLYFSVWSAFSTIDCPVVDFLFAIVLCVFFMYLHTFRTGKVNGERSKKGKLYMTHHIFLCCDLRRFIYIYIYTGITLFLSFINIMNITNMYLHQ